MGLDLGIEGTNRFDVLSCIEKKKAFCEMIRLNQQAGRFSEEIRVYETDVWQLYPEKLMGDCGLVLGELDLLIGYHPARFSAWRDGEVPPGV